MLWNWHGGDINTGYTRITIPCWDEGFFLETFKTNSWELNFWRTNEANFMRVIKLYIGDHLKRANTQISLNIGKSAKNPAGILRLFITACFYTSRGFNFGSNLLDIIYNGQFDIILMIHSFRCFSCSESET